ncbi:hypothetical protein BHE74_00047113 [Ensete ventricosum]|nr:hypothetical protein BHE74_00047113 [Ensete ventricosum]
MRARESSGKPNGQTRTRVRQIWEEEPRLTIPLSGNALQLSCLNVFNKQGKTTSHWKRDWAILKPSVVRIDLRLVGTRSGVVIYSRKKNSTKWTEKGRRWYVVDVARLKTAAEGVNRPSKEEDEQPEEQERIRGCVLLTAVGGGRSTRHCPPEEEGHGCMAATVAGDGEGYIARDNDYSSG